MSWFRRWLVRIAIVAGLPLPRPERAAAKAREVVDELARVRPPIGSSRETFAREVARDVLARGVEDGFDVEEWLVKLLYSYEESLRDRRALLAATTERLPYDSDRVEQTVWEEEEVAYDDQV